MERAAFSLTYQYFDFNADFKAIIVSSPGYLPRAEAADEIHSQSS